jgi:hypothetical protein
MAQKELFQKVVQPQFEELKKLVVSREVFEANQQILRLLVEAIAAALTSPVEEIQKGLSFQVNGQERGMTKRKAYGVFISSTFIDNEERRKTVEDAIISAGMLPVGMERFTASTRPTVDYNTIETAS